MAIAKQWVSSEMNYAGIPCTYNSALDPPTGAAGNARLTICLRVRLFKMDASARGGVWTTTIDRCGQQTTESVPIRDWRDSEWQLFVQECFVMASFWSFRFYLEPPPGYAGLDEAFGATRVRPLVECRFMPVFVDASAGPHVRYEVAHVDDAADARYRATGEKARLTSYTSRDVAVAGMLSSQTNLARLIEAPDDKGKTWQTRQAAFPHELGHALGLPHAGLLFHNKAALQVANQGGTCRNARTVYGAGLPHDVADNIMGLGSSVAAVNALPWTHRIGMHLAERVDPGQWGVIVRQEGEFLAPRRL